MRFFYQEDLNDCGLACLSMLIHYHHHQLVSPYQLKKMLSSQLVSAGVSFYDLISLASNFRLQGSGYFCDFDLIKQQTKFPFLVNIKGHNDLNHFVLVVEIGKSQIKLLDPNVKFGHRTLNWSEFRSCYCGQILIFEKLGDWKPQVPWKIIAAYGRKGWKWIFFTTLFTLTTNYLWFLSNFFIRALEDWFVQGSVDYLVLAQYLAYIGGGSAAYLLQSHFIQRLEQFFWQELIDIHLRDNEIEVKSTTIDNGFWDLIHHHHQALISLANLVIKFFNYLILLPFIVLNMVQNHLVILLLYLIFISTNFLINHLIFKLYAQTRDELDWKKSQYSSQLAYYLTNSSTFKKRQVTEINWEILTGYQTKYFKSERKYQWRFFWSDLNLQLTQRIANLVFWALILFFIFKNLSGLKDWLVLILLTQFSTNIALDFTNNLLAFCHQKHFLSDLKPLIRGQIGQFNARLDIGLNPLIQFQDFTFEAPGNVHLVPNATFKSPLQIQGLSTHLDGCYQACCLKRAGISINSQPLSQYRKEIFAIDHEALPVGLTVANNLFLGRSTASEANSINLSFWLNKYRLDLTTPLNQLNLALDQLQILSFMSLLLSDYSIYFLNQPLSSISQEDQFVLWELLFKLKKDKCLIIWGDINLKSDFTLNQMNLEDMV